MKKSLIVLAALMAGNAFAMEDAAVKAFDRYEKALEESDPVQLKETLSTLLETARPGELPWPTNMHSMLSEIALVHIINHCKDRRNCTAMIDAAQDHLDLKKEFKRITTPDKTYPGPDDRASLLYGALALSPYATQALFDRNMIDSTVAGEVLEQACIAFVNNKERDTMQKTARIIATHDKLAKNAQFFMNSLIEKNCDNKDSKHNSSDCAQWRTFAQTFN